LSKRLEGLQALRAFACLLVLLQHASFYALGLKDLLSWHGKWVCPIVAPGVPLFFLISGYVMGLCLEQRNFLLNRAARIYPPYWIALLISFLFAYIMGVPWHINKNAFFLLPKGHFGIPYPVPAWTLVYEMIFYGAVYAMILTRLTRQKISWVCGLWLLMIGMGEIFPSFLKMNNPSGWLLPNWWIFLSPYCVFFIGGLLLFITTKDFFKNLSTPSLWCGVVGCYCLAQTQVTFKLSIITNLLQALSYSFLLHACLRMSFPQWVRRGGDFSYGVYLMHMAPMAMACDFFKPSLSCLPFIAVFLIMFSLGTGCGLLFGWGEFILYRHFVKPLVELFSPSKNGAKNSIMLFDMRR
jgi:peptidoglycan/LPS O-acetylase OafA/YrhL